MLVIRQYEDIFIFVGQLKYEKQKEELYLLILKEQSHHSAQ